MEEPQQIPQNPQEVTFKLSHFLQNAFLSDCLVVNKASGKEYP